MSDKTLREQVPDSVPDDIDLFGGDDTIYGRDEHGEFKIKPMAGSSTPQDGRCGWVLRYTMDRYGETRYCTRLPECKFVDDGSKYCRTHKSAEALMEHAEELFKHGYFATNYINFVEKLSTPKFLFAVEMVGGLFKMSEHDFDVVEETRTLDTSDSELISEDAIDVGLPIPRADNLSLQSNELWMATLKEVMQQNMQEAIFNDGVSKQTLAQSADMEGQITDTLYESTEHHLLLPISRLPGDIKDHLKNGGVAIDDADSGVVTFQQNDYTLDVSPADGANSDAEDASETAHDFATELQDDAAEIEV